MILTTLYVLFKLISLSKDLTLVLTFMAAFKNGELAYGRYASREEIVEQGSECSICQEDAMDAIVLECGTQEILQAQE